MGRIWFLPVLVAIWVCGADAVHACSCTPRSTLCGPPGEFWHASDVFSARVVRIERGSHSTERRVQVEVIERWRGSVPAAGTVAVFTRSSALCGYPFKTGREYLIYGSRSEDGRLTTGGCSRTALLERASEDVRYARGASKGTVPAGRVVGDVRVKSAGRRTRGLPDISVVLTSGQLVRSALTDAEGRYSVELTSSGRHHLDVELPQSVYARQPPERIDVSDPHACFERRIEVSFNGRITGRIVDHTGRGVAGLAVSHLPLEHRPPSDGRTSVLTRDDGSFEIARLAAGRFRIQVEPPVDGADETVSVATGVLGEGERLPLDAFALPASLRLARLEGIVVGSDGWNMADARVFLKGPSGGRVLGVPATSDGLGRFVLAIVEGGQYHIFAERPSGQSEFSEPISVIAERKMRPLRLVVRPHF